MPEDIPEQSMPAIEQALTERANADALGLTDAVEAADKRLAALGYEKPTKAQEKAAEKRAKAAEEDDDAKSEPPKGRSAAKQSSTAD